MQFASRWWSILKEALLTVLAAVLAVLIYAQVQGFSTKVKGSLAEKTRSAVARPPLWGSAPVQIRGVDFDRLVMVISGECRFCVRRRGVLPIPPALGKANDVPI
jgi:hypothetical protein